MNKPLYLIILVVFFFSSCMLLPLPQSAEIELTYTPNPVTDGYYDGNYGWSFYSDITISEKNNISVTLGNYGPNGCCCYGQLIVNGKIVETYYYDESDVESWFGTLTIEGGSYIKENDALFTTGNYPSAKMSETYYGKDENGNLVSCSNTLILDASKKKKKI
ncbi:MAG: hypothetical protein QME48_06830 [bacterium]|nr:hypothetical protein [bacterium]